MFISLNLTYLKFVELLEHVDLYFSSNLGSLGPLFLQMFSLPFFFWDSLNLLFLLKVSSTLYPPNSLDSLHFFACSSDYNFSGPVFKIANSVFVCSNLLLNNSSEIFILFVPFLLQNLCLVLFYNVCLFVDILTLCMHFPLISFPSLSIFSITDLSIFKRVNLKFITMFNAVFSQV